MADEFKIDFSNDAEKEVKQDMLGTLDVYADIVYCIDITQSMIHTIDLVKRTAVTLHKDLQEIMRTNYQRSIKQLRVKVIGFRDFYADGQYALECSDFFTLPEQTGEFNDFVSGLEAKGGGDFPENSLEALALAMKSQWCTSADASVRKRHIIILFTDASAHPFEKNADNKPPTYPEGMPKDYSELIDWWNGQGSLGDTNSVGMDQMAKRIGIFAPEGCEPWSIIEEDFTNCLMSYINPDDGGKDISTERLLKLLGETIS